jgi:hypothetical protein
MPETWVNYQRRRVENASLMTNLRRRIFYASSLRGVKGDMFLPTRVSNDSPQRRHLLSTRVTYVSHWRDAYWQPTSPLRESLETLIGNPRLLWWIKKNQQILQMGPCSFFTHVFLQTAARRNQKLQHMSQNTSLGAKTHQFDNSFTNNSLQN